MRNIEIKAVLKNPEEAHSRAKQLSEGEGRIIVQSDTFFKAEEGRFKLRCYEDGSGDLIHYERSDTEGPKLSDYSIIKFPDKSACESIKSMLEKANGILGVVEKKRHLYIVGKSRIHIDKVTDLGDFIEIEVVLDDNQDLKEGEDICNDLMTKLAISKDDLLSIAYIDLLLEKESEK